MSTVTYLGGVLGQREVLVGEDSPGVVLGCSAASHSMLWTVPAPLVVSQHLLCSPSPQMPFLLLNPSMPEIRPRMYPVFFGESIEVNPEPVQEIRYRWDWVGRWGFLSFFCQKLKRVYKWESRLFWWKGKDRWEGNSSIKATESSTRQRGRGKNWREILTEGSFLSKAS